MSVTQSLILNMEVFVNDRELSDIEIFQHSGKGIPLFTTDHKTACKPITTMDGVSSVLKTERNNICVANDRDQSAELYKEIFSTEIEDQGSLYSVLKSRNTKYEVVSESSWIVIVVTVSVKEDE
jgi:hypothetical protein